jgi:hypothetical protein
MKNSATGVVKGSAAEGQGYWEDIGNLLTKARQISLNFK